MGLKSSLSCLPFPFLLGEEWGKELSLKVAAKQPPLAKFQRFCRLRGCCTSLHAKALCPQPLTWGILSQGGNLGGDDALGPLKENETCQGVQSCEEYRISAVVHCAGERLQHEHGAHVFYLGCVVTLSGFLKAKLKWINCSLGCGVMTALGPSAFLAWPCSPFSPGALSCPLV